MCGIFSILNGNEISHDFVNIQFQKGQTRGPESSKLVKSLKLNMGFHRLAINGLNEKSNQPFNIDDIMLICNGEIYNYKKLYEQMGVIPKTDSDCEVIIHLYLKYGIEQTLQLLDGVFAFVLLDNRVLQMKDNDIQTRVYIARDPYGVRPLYYLKNNSVKPNKTNNLYGFSSEIKCLSEFLTISKEYDIEHFKPGTYSAFNLSSKVISFWKPIVENMRYFVPSFSHYYPIDKTLLAANDRIMMDYKEYIFDYLFDAVNKRCLTTERPIACLLSGGLDSSLITALVDRCNKCNNGSYKKLETYSIGLVGSEDLKYARIVADYIGTNHTEIIVTEKEMFDAIPEVIYAIESYDTTSIRASIGNYLIGKYISKNSDAKVIFNGDGSDEICGGYLYMQNCPDSIEFDTETRRLLTDIHKFDVLRSDKCISSHGLEPRTPFLDKTFVNYYLSIPHEYRFETNKICEKNLLRSSFDYQSDKPLLPKEILWRRKEAFSDGVSSQGRSLYQILQEHISLILTIETPDIKYEANIETEKYYYKTIFDKFYPGCDNIIPYFWMPKYTSATDPSARTLAVYNISESSSTEKKALQEENLQI